MLYKITVPEGTIIYAFAGSKEEIHNSMHEENGALCFLQNSPIKIEIPINKNIKIEEVDAKS